MGFFLQSVEVNDDNGMFITSSWARAAYLWSKPPVNSFLEASGVGDSQASVGNKRLPQVHIVMNGQETTQVSVWQ